LKVVIDVDIDCPERNREVTVWQIDFVNSLVPEVCYKGYNIFVMVDIRYLCDAEDKEGEVHFRGVVHGRSGREVMLRVPAMEHSLLHDRDELIASVDTASALKMDGGRHKFVKDPERHRKHIRLVFPEGHTLSSGAIFDEGGTQDGDCAHRHEAQEVCGGF